MDFNKREHAYGLGEFVVGELGFVLSGDVSNMDPDIYGRVNTIMDMLCESSDDGMPVEVSCLFDELVHMDLGIYSKSIHQAAIVYSVLLAYWSDTAHPQLHFSWSKR